MPVFRTHATRFAPAFRAVAGLAGILLLLLQSFGPALANTSQGDWIEICADGGAVWIQVDTEDGIGDPTMPCPKCADCALCAVAGSAPLLETPEIVRLDVVRFVRLDCPDLYEPHNPAHLWPETRGPPAASHYKSEHAPSATMASFQVTGGAPWS
ncbi:MAG: hypothetical protein ACR2O2_16675 [Ruegeria sp.]